MKLDNNGQSLFEFIIFLPLMLILYAGLMSFGNSINGSINQQKIARSYFFSKIKGNSMLPRNDDLKDKAWQNVGMYFIGWAESIGGGSIGQPLAPCYHVQTYGAPENADNCEDSYETTTTQYVRPMTIFGMCTATYSFVDNNWYPNPILGATPGGCIIQ